jgi:glycosyltransferase involved in cell wall biosynthesis
MKITMLLSNGFNPDPRVAAEALALAKAGHAVTIFAWDRLGSLPEEEDYQGVQVRRCRIRSGYSKGPLQIFNFIKFWGAARRFLQANPPQAIHCHDLDTLQAGITMGRRLKVPVIFDAHECYPEMVAHLFPGPMVGLIRRLEKRLVPQAAVVITVGSVLAAYFLRMGARKVSIVGNYKSLAGEEPPATPARSSLKIIYIGGLNRDRLLAPAIRAVAGTPEFDLTIVGNGPEQAVLEELAGKAANIRFTGFLPQDEACDLLTKSHLLYYAIDSSYPNNRFSAPNSLFMALAAGRPVICNDMGEIAAIVRAEKAGTVLPDLEPVTIRQALKAYFDKELWKAQSEAAFTAARERYNWDRAAVELVRVYRELGK